MKKIMLSALLIGALGFTSCGSDDDGGEETTETCETCTLQSIESKYCDNGDGTITITVAGQSQEVPLSGVSFSDYISLLETAGATCK
ncbi:MAG: hypothetical protein ABJK28_11645 [Algibacter sp.]